MMHPNFYHWHAHAELKPEPAILEPRWNAAEKFAENLSAADICSLLRLVLFSGGEPDFAKRFSEALVKLEPTFPPEHNAELLRVMATAAVYSQMDDSSKVADAIALGLQAAAFPQGRIEPVCQEVMTRAAEYLVTESERVRPAIYADTLESAEEQTETHLAALKKAVEGNTLPEIGNAIAELGRGVLAGMKISHQQLGEVIGRLTEESQFLWWLVGRYSSALDKRRESLAAETYALPAAEEAAKRVALLPPAASVEFLLDEALAQCAKGEPTSILLANLIAAVDAKWMQSVASTIAAPELTPLAALLAKRRADEKLETTFLKRLHISPKLKTTPSEAARQYFRELIFLRAIEQMG